MNIDQYSNNPARAENLPTSSFVEAARAAVRAAQGETLPARETPYELPELAADYVELESLSGNNLPDRVENVTTGQAEATVIPLSSKGGAALGSMVGGLRDAA